MWLFVPVGVLILLVLTNDLHQRFFAFQKDFVNSTSNYTRQGVQCNHRVALLQTNSRYEALYSQTDMDTWITDENL